MRYVGEGVQEPDREKYFEIIPARRLLLLILLINASCLIPKCVYIEVIRQKRVYGATNEAMDVPVWYISSIFERNNNNKNKINNNNNLANLANAAKG